MNIDGNLPAEPAQEKESCIDLHTHSNASDGTLTPEELMNLATEKGLAAVALTDHDTVAGLEKAGTFAASHEIELIPGIELSTNYEDTEVHILGYYIDKNNSDFLSRLMEFRAGRDDRNERMADKLREFGFDISIEQLKEAFPECVLTRAHFARFLVDHGFVRDMNTVFLKYLGDGCRCYVPREKITPFEAIELIQMGGGLAYFAHPILCRMNGGRMDKFVKDMKACGLTGLEGIYSTYTLGEERIIRRLAKKYDLLLSGGSDFHGSNKPFIQLGTGRGNLHIPYGLLGQMKERLSSPKRS